MPITTTEHGAGRTIVLVHATLHDSGDYAALVPPLADNHRVVQVDWTADTPDELVDLLDEVAARVGRAVYVGNSVGGYAAARLAQRRPADVAGVVLVNSAGFTRHSVATRLFCRFMGYSMVAGVALPLLARLYLCARTESDRSALVRLRERAHSADGARRAARMWRSFPGIDLRASPPGCPTLLVWGTRDLVTAGDDARAAAAIEGARLVRMRTGHVPFSSDPDEFLAHLVAFIAKVEPMTGIEPA